MRKVLFLKFQTKVLWKTLKLHKGVEKQFQFEVINFHSFAWIFNTTNIQNESTYTEFFRKQDAQLSDHLDDPEIFELVKTFQVHIYSRTCWKYINNEFSLSFNLHLPEKTTITKPIGSKLRIDKKEDVLMWINTPLRRVKS